MNKNIESFTMKLREENTGYFEEVSGKILWMGHKIIEENAYKFCFLKLKIFTEQKPVRRKGFFLILFTPGINVKKNLQKLV